MYDLGATVPIATTLKDAVGDNVNATSVTLTITLPDGTTATPVVTNPPATTGEYQVDYTSAQEGRHAYRFVFTGPAAAITGVFDIRAEVDDALFSLLDGKRYLNIPATNTTDDEEIRDFIAAVTRIVEDKVGSVARRSHTEIKRTCGESSVTLNHGPVLSVTSALLVEDDSVAHDVDDLEVDDAAILFSKTGASLPTRAWRVTYVAGRSIVPASSSRAGAEILRHLWKTQRGGAVLPLQGGDDMGDLNTGLGYLIPYRALGLLEPDEQSWGFA